MLNTLQQFCNQWGLVVNMAKTKITVFRNGGPLKHFENRYFKGSEIEIVSHYKYPGMIFSSRLNWNQALQALNSQAEKALHTLRKLHYRCGFLTAKLSFKLFGTTFVPILTYASDVWDYCCYEVIENAQTKYCKFVLGVRSTENNCAALGELIDCHYHVFIKLNVYNFG